MRASAETTRSRQDVASLPSDLAQAFSGIVAPISTKMHALSLYADVIAAADAQWGIERAESAARALE